MQENPNEKHSSSTSSAPALFVSGSPEGVSAEVLRELVACTGFTLAVDAGAEQVLKAGIAPDLLLGDFDSISPETLAAYEAKGVPVQAFDPYKNATDVELGLEALASLGYRRAIATNVLGGRTDHALGSLGALAGAVAKQGMTIVVRDQKEVCCFASTASPAQNICLDTSSETTVISVSSERGMEGAGDFGEQPLLTLPVHPRYASLISWGGPATVSFTGTEWELHQHVLSPYSARGVSNLLRASRVQLKVHEGPGVVLLLLTL